MDARVAVEGSLNSCGSCVDSKFKRKQSQQQQIGTVEQLLAGGVAGAFSKTCTAPLARLTILFQVQGMHSDIAALNKASIRHEFSRFINEEGVRAFWKCNLVTIAHRLPYSSVNFYAYEQFKSMFQSVLGLENGGGSSSAKLCVHFAAGGLSGITVVSATYPLDLVRTRLAIQTTFRTKTKQFHPDQNPDNKEAAEEKFKQVLTTYKAIKEERKDVK